MRAMAELEKGGGAVQAGRAGRERSRDAAVPGTLRPAGPRRGCKPKERGRGRVLGLAPLLCP